MGWKRKLAHSPERINSVGSKCEHPSQLCQLGSSTDRRQGVGSNTLGETLLVSFTSASLAFIISHPLPQGSEYKLPSYSTLFSAPLLIVLSKG